MFDPNQPPGPYTIGEHIIPPPRPSSPATAEYRLNHLMLRIKNPEESLRFYNDCFGLHVVFIFNPGPWTIYYLGPRDINPTILYMNYSRSLIDVDISTLGASKGLIELYHIPADASTPYVSGNDYSAPGVGFGHIGFTVPDVAKTIERVKDFGYEVIKPLGEAKVEQMGLPDTVVKGNTGVVDEGYKHVFRQLAFVRDPDGYWVELVPHVLKPI
ncbi:Glyoxalase/Bleomycin resistance protein/Dihydroxybiphenyl dioxygenase [Lojkania enalia]|uniref:Glyoxalase/Bleomycin resistance protein/Dihydroxybiphenyl dioxygenase n=1 Tax=Lojkania enalia TaxID=147567 RepID=A0A9P4JY42_9PLEO|nr:Glyoxalase/Bleomycin resistance protein/Dihydroxybiphenyl dioxygenase [Didymosphaeria enalia]